MGSGCCTERDEPELGKYLNDMMKKSIKADRDKIKDANHFKSVPPSKESGQVIEKSRGSKYGRKVKR